MYHKMIQYIHIWLYMYHNGDILLRVFVSNGKRVLFDTADVWRTMSGKLASKTCNLQLTINEDGEAISECSLEVIKIEGVTPK